MDVEMGFKLNSLLDSRLNNQSFRDLNQYHFVFVKLDPFQNFFLNIYTDAYDELKSNLNAPYVSYASSNLLHPLFKTEQRLKKELSELYNRHKKPMVIFGDPGTGPDVLHFEINNPSFVRDGLISKTIIVQGAVNGSRVIDKFFWPAARWPKIRKILSYFLSSEKIDFFKFSTWSIQSAFEEAIKHLNDDDVALLRKNVFYTRSTQTRRKMHSLVKLVSWFLHISSEEKPGDGFTETDSQVLKSIDGAILGNDLGVFMADHWDLTHSIWFDSNLLRQKRKIFLRGLLAIVLTGK